MPLPLPLVTSLHWMLVYCLLSLKTEIYIREVTHLKRKASLRLIDTALNCVHGYSRSMPISRTQERIPELNIQLAMSCCTFLFLKS